MGLWRKKKKKKVGGAVFRYYTVTALTIGNDGNLETQQLPESAALIGKKIPSIHSFSRLRCQAEVEAWKFTLLEKLPPVLILHLKYFIYDSKGGLQKLSKKVEYPVDLEINKGILSHSIRTASPHRYKLFAGEFNKLSVLYLYLQLLGLDQLGGKTNLSFWSPFKSGLSSREIGDWRSLHHGHLSHRRQRLDSHGRCNSHKTSART